VLELELGLGLGLALALELERVRELAQASVEAALLLLGGLLLMVGQWTLVRLLLLRLLRLLHTPAWCRKQIRVLQQLPLEVFWLTPSFSHQPRVGGSCAPSSCALLPLYSSFPAKIEGYCP
jgi:hypothetical protein